MAICPIHHRGDTESSVDRASIHRFSSSASPAGVSAKSGSIQGCAPASRGREVRAQSFGTANFPWAPLSPKGEVGECISIERGSELHRAVTAAEDDAD